MKVISSIIYHYLSIISNLGFHHSLKYYHFQSYVYMRVYTSTYLNYKFSGVSQSWRCLTIVQLRQTCCIPLSLKLGSRTIDSRSQRSSQRFQANMLIGFDIETPSTFVLTFSLSDFVFCSGLKTPH